MTLAFVLGVLFVCAAAPMAAAERAIAVDVPAAAPFDAVELRRALALRLPPDGAQVAVRVAVGDEGVVQVIAGERARQIDVAGFRGAAAARLVALAASDLLLDDLADAAPPPAALRDSMMTIGGLGAVSAWPHALAGGAIDLTLPARPVRIAIELGGATLVAADVRMTALTARIAAALRPHDAVELRGGVTLVPIFVGNGAGDRTVLAGGHAMVRLRVPVQARLHAVLAAGADVFATRTDYRVNGMPVFITPRIAPLLGIGIEVTP